MMSQVGTTIQSSKHGVWTDSPVVTYKLRALANLGIRPYLEQRFKQPRSAYTDVSFCSCLSQVKYFDKNPNKRL